MHLFLIFSPITIRNTIFEDFFFSNLWKSFRSFFKEFSCSISYNDVSNNSSEDSSMNNTRIHSCLCFSSWFSLGTPPGIIPIFSPGNFDAFPLGVFQEISRKNNLETSPKVFFSKKSCLIYSLILQEIRSRIAFFKHFFLEMVQKKSTGIVPKFTIPGEFFLQIFGNSFRNFSRVSL